MRLIILFLPACLSTGDKSYEEDDSVYFEDASVVCDPTVSAFDDYFLFEAWTGGSAVSVDVRVLDGGDLLDEMAMEEADDGYWTREVWADDLGTDCDAFYGLRFVFEARGADGSEAEAEAAG